jgi:anti-anti-sigma regulatory factor
VKIEIERQGARVMFKLLGLVTRTGNAAEFADTVHRAMITADADVIVLDFSEASLPDSRCIGKVVELFREFDAAGKKTYILCHENPDVLELFSLAYVDTFIPVVEHREDIPG